MDNHIDYNRVAYLVLDPQGNQVHASNYQHLADAYAMGCNRITPGHTIVTQTPWGIFDVEEAQNYLSLEGGSVVYEAQRLVETTLEGTIDPDSYDENWLPVSKPLASLDMAMGVIDWIKSKENENYIFRVVEITIKRQVIWPEV